MFPIHKRFVLFRIVFIASLFLAGCNGDKKSSDETTTQPTPQVIDAKPIETIDTFIKHAKIDKTAPDWKTTLPKPPKLTFNTDENYYWDLNTNKGKISILFKPDVAPMHVSNAIYLTRLGFYDGIIFHRVIPGFMAQGGDPLGTGNGNPGYVFDGEFKGASHNKIGILSTANAGPGTDGSQFFITFKPVTRLDGGYTVYGEMVDGFDTLKELEKFGSKPYGRTTEKLVINSAAIRVEPK